MIIIIPLNNRPWLIMTALPKPKVASQASCQKRQLKTKIIASSLAFLNGKSVFEWEFLNCFTSRNSVVSRVCGQFGGDCCGAALYHCERFRSFKADVACCAANMCLTCAIYTGRCGRVFLLSFLSCNLNANMVICACSQSSCDAALYYCERFRSFKADVACCAANIYLTSAIHTGRCGRVYSLSFLLWNVNAKMVICACSLVVMRHYVIVHVLGVLKQMWRVVLLIYI